MLTESIFSISFLTFFFQCGGVLCHANFSPSDPTPHKLIAIAQRICLLSPLIEKLWKYNLGNQYFPFGKVTGKHV